MLNCWLLFSVRQNMLRHARLDNWVQKIISEVFNSHTSYKVITHESNTRNSGDHIGGIFKFRLQITPANQSQSHSVWDQHTTHIRKTAPSIITHNLFHLPPSSAHTASSYSCLYTIYSLQSAL